MKNVVIPAQAGIQAWEYLLDSGLGFGSMRRSTAYFPVGTSQ